MTGKRPRRKRERKILSELPDIESKVQIVADGGSRFCVGCFDVVVQIHHRGARELVRTGHAKWVAVSPS
jgi:hypothetical protein